MKVKELEKLIRESVKNTIGLKENFSLDDEGIGPSPKVDQAVEYAVQCASVLAGDKPKPATITGSSLDRCFGQIVALFVSPSGELVYPVDPTDLKNEFLDTLAKKTSGISPKAANAASLILDKAVDKINAHMSEAMFAESLMHLEAGSEIPTDPNWFDTVTGTDSSNPPPTPGFNKKHIETKKHIEMFKNILKAHRAKLNQDNFHFLVDDYADEHHLNFDMAWEIAQVALDELQDANLLESFAKTRKPRKK